MTFSLRKYLSLLGSKQSSNSESDVIGIDVGSSSIKVVELKKSEDVISLVTYGELQLGPYAGFELGRTAALSEKKLTEAVVDVIRESAATSNNGLLAIPYGSSFMTVVSIEASNEEEIASRIPVEARKYIPVQLKDVTLDWFPVATTTTENGMRQDVLLAAIHNDAITRYRGVMQGVGMGGGQFEIEVFSAMRSAMRHDDDHVAIIDCGASASRVYVIEGGTVKQMYSLRYGGEALTRAIAEDKKIAFAEAETLKRADGLRSDGSVRAIAEKHTRKIFMEAQHILKQYERDHDSSVSRVILTGGGAEMIGISALGSDILSRSVTIADPFSKVAYPAFMEDVLTAAGPDFSVAIGAALRPLL